MSKIKKKVPVDLSLTPGGKKKLGDALNEVEKYLATAKMQQVLAVWPKLTEMQRLDVMASAPLFARLVALCKRLV